MKMFKWVHKTVNHPRSCVMYDEKELGVDYPPLEWATAPIGGLLVFDTMKAALDFAKQNCDSQKVLYKCAVRDEVKLPGAGPRFCVHTIKNLWAGEHVGEAEIGIEALFGRQWPAGTRAFKQVMLLEQVPQEEMLEYEKHADDF
jgi:hypothetical protein